LYVLVRAPLRVSSLSPYTTLFRSATSRRKTLWVWVVVVTLFVSAVWVAVSTIHSSFQPLSVIKEPFPDEANRPEASEHDRGAVRSEEHTSELQSRFDLVCRLLLAK